MNDWPCPSCPLFYGINAFEYDAGTLLCGDWRNSYEACYREKHLQRCRDWVWAVGTRNASAITHFTIKVELMLGSEEGKRDEPSRWWNDMRKLEQTMLHPLLAPSAIFVKVSFFGLIELKRFRHPDDGRKLDFLERYAIPVYTMPTFDKKLARDAVEDQSQQKLAHFDCLLERHAWLPPWYVSESHEFLRLSRAYLLKALAD